jgi:excinuclease UvrABC nuclease subunit
MQDAAEALRFEEAARVRDQIQAIAQTTEKQQVATPLGNDQDIFGLYREGGFVEIEVLLYVAVNWWATSNMVLMTTSSPMKRCCRSC